MVGNSGKHESDNGKMYPAMYKKYAADKGVGSMILDIKGNTLTASYFKENGELFDKFRIVKIDTSSVISGIRNNTAVQDVKIYPNPFSNTISIEFVAKESKPTSISVQNIAGVLVTETVWTGKSFTGNNKIELNNLQQLPAGEYIISIKQNNEMVSEKVIKL